MAVVRSENWCGGGWLTALGGARRGWLTYGRAGRGSARKQSPGGLRQRDGNGHLGFVGQDNLPEERADRRQCLLKHLRDFLFTREDLVWVLSGIPWQLLPSHEVAHPIRPEAQGNAKQRSEGRFRVIQTHKTGSRANRCDHFGRATAKSAATAGAAAVATIIAT